MTQIETKRPLKRYTLREVQASAQIYGLLIQPLTTKTSPYGIFFEGQLIWQCNKLTEVMEALPRLYTSIQEQLALQAKAIAPKIEDAIALSAACKSDESIPILEAEEADETLSKDKIVTFAHHFYEDVTNWELRDRMNNLGYSDGANGKPPQHNYHCYMTGYNRGVRDKQPV